MMRKCFALLIVTLLVTGFSVGCQGFKGFCDRGSFWPTSQQKLTPAFAQALYTGDMVAADNSACCGQVVTNACDPCCNSMAGSTSISGPIIGN
ncbi:MAG: hypothetical protein FWC50_07345 [Planctomycetaceae bacterium]|nr:hypothetical protein [Planctomycetaceae bacterium]